jgi:hypothetical protein
VEEHEITRLNQNAAASQLHMQFTEHDGSIYRGHRQGIAAPHDTQIKREYESAHTQGCC